MQYNGNISETIWRTANDVSTNKTRAYAYQYDALSRITGADYGIKTTGSYNLASGFDMGVGLYDKNGNIKSLWRDNMANTKIDQLSYTYANAEVSNKLLKVEDSSGSPEGFKNGDNLATEYTYDGNGNMLRDYNKGITTNISYNYLNLPSQITFASGNIQYIYDAAGTKQKKIVTEATGTITTIYAGNYVYQNNVLQMINQPEGYLEPNGLGTYDYGYRLKDHLGNIRLTFVDFDHNGSIALSEITEENNYYPFGLKHQGYNNIVNSNTNAVAGKFKYNSKELNDELDLDWYDYGARFYMADLGRWTTPDPEAEQYRRWSPYNYAVNNPIRFTDPDGMNISDFLDKEGNLVSHVNDGSNAVFQQTGSGTNLHYESTGKFSDQGGVDKVTDKAVTSVIQEQQNLNNSNPALQQDYDAKTQKYGNTHCNQATQNVEAAVGSALGKDIFTPGKANDVAGVGANSIAKNPAYKSATYEEAQEVAASGGLAILTLYKSPGSGHLATFSVGENIQKGPIANIGKVKATGFKYPLGTPGTNQKDAVFTRDDWKTVNFYILK